ncbi:hypothetical protein BFP97_08695 [Roseivirga sp. 4D4]|uniref:hypothetical protein n=1 Tax=Roseivirga sp. 4D4 TaxID=1889784 RepID=UPI0008537AC7|nr:hypothetical protein [Roseivirga sp. 4D4]OEK01590.1 hypothetical protein BFP97_08695 [Roseivirga sp. 4D4]
MTLILACTSTPPETPNDYQKATEEYFNQIKDQPHLLREFLWAMPKGGDIHHHALGAVWAEDYLNIASEKNFLINPKTFRLYANQTVALSNEDTTAIDLNQYLDESPDHRDMIIDSWSMRNQSKNSLNGRDHFFNTFQKFEEAMSGNEIALLSKICEAAAAENIQYLETMVGVPSIMNQVADLTVDKAWKPGISIKDHLADWYAYLEQQNIDTWADYNAEVMDHWIENIDSKSVHLAFQTVGMRVIPDLAVVFSHLVLAFKTAVLSENVVGVNFVAPEDDPTALQNYSAHMAMFRFLTSKFPQVSLSLHAGELNESVKEDNTKDHIYQAISLANTQRIGHGFDILHQDNYLKTMDLMKAKGVAVEINLETNKVILESDSSTHPLKAYLAAGVPVCISSDDPAILRSDLTNQYIMATQYVPNLRYAMIKDLVYNSINYSFLDSNRKEELLSDLKEAFERFEFQIMTKNKGALGLQALL